MRMLLRGAVGAVGVAETETSGRSQLPLFWRVRGLREWTGASSGRGGGSSTGGSKEEEERWEGGSDPPGGETAYEILRSSGLVNEEDERSSGLVDEGDGRSEKKVREGQGEKPTTMPMWCEEMAVEAGRERKTTERAERS